MGRAQAKVELLFVFYVYVACVHLLFMFMSLVSIYLVFELLAVCELYEMCW